MKYLLALPLLLSALTPAAAHAAVQYRHFTSHICTYSINYPVPWRVKSTPTKHADVFKDPHHPIVSATVGCLPTGGVLTIPKIIGVYRGGLQQTGFTVGPTHISGGVAIFDATKTAFRLSGHTYEAMVEVTLVLNRGFLFVLTFTDQQSNWNHDSPTYRYMKSTWSVLKGR